MRKSLLISGLLAAATFAACSQAPTPRIDAARQARQSAEDAQAPVYAPDAWNQVKDTESQLDAELDVQKNKVALFRQYGKAGELAGELEKQSNEAAQAALAGKQKTKDEATALVSQAKDEYEQTKKALATAPKGKGTEADLASLKSDAGSVETSLQEMQAALDGGDYMKAKSKAQAALDSLKQIRDQIEAARKARSAA